ncbi:MAG: hypothetical protein ACOC1X_02380 [Promethearchaeota archaeon]
MFSYKEVPISQYWLGNLTDFYSWCEMERKRLRPTNPHAQSLAVGEGLVAFCNEYPTFEDAYKEYLKQFKE